MSAKAAAWYATFLCVLALTLSLVPVVRETGAFYGVFFSYLPVVFFAIARQEQDAAAAIRKLEQRIAQLEGR
jgi:hypothetical protein